MNHIRDEQAYKP